MRVAIYGRYFFPENRDQLNELFQQLALYDAKLFIEERYYRLISDHIGFDEGPSVFDTGESLKGKVDFLLSIGGDGTLLDTVTIVRDSGIPVLGINTGRMGFLSGVATDQVKQAIRNLKEQRFYLDQRTLLHLDSEKGYFGKLNFALNELSVHRREIPSLITIQVWVDDVFLNSYWADGLIVSTPTGSTGYSLSCGGPIIYPQAGNFIITPIATHNLTVRPIVIPDGKKIKVKVRSRHGHYTAALDARYCEIAPGDELVVSKEKFQLNLIHFEQEEFFTTIREKLKWGLDSRN
jgi:NAD+ kinase